MKIDPFITDEHFLSLLIIFNKAILLPFPSNITQTAMKINANYNTKPLTEYEKMLFRYLPVLSPSHHLSVDLITPSKEMAP
jgi:hypothetical protein